MPVCVSKRFDEFDELKEDTSYERYRSQNGDGKTDIKKTNQKPIGNLS